MNAFRRMEALRAPGKEAKAWQPRAGSGSEAGMWFLGSSVMMVGGET